MTNSNVIVSLLAFAGNLQLGPIPNLVLRKSAKLWLLFSWLLKVAPFLELPRDFTCASPENLPGVALLIKPRLLMRPELTPCIGRETRYWEFQNT